MFSYNKKFKMGGGVFCGNLFIVVIYVIILNDI